mgnify:CR=1 FL=1
MVRGIKLRTPQVPYSLQEIKECIANLEGHPVQWDLNRHDGRKKRMYVEGKIVRAYQHHFTIQLDSSKRITSFSYVDLYASQIKILSLLDGENILNRLRKGRRDNF